MKKLLYLTTIFISIFILRVSAYADAPLSFTSDLLLPEATCNAEYYYELQATGGTSPYKYTMVSDSYLPRGLTLHENGVISGTPLDGDTTYFHVEVTVTDSAVPPNTVTEIFTMPIYAQKVDFEAGQNMFVYDGKEHIVELIPMIDGADARETITNYQITYRGAASQKNVGTYRIQIDVLQPGYVFGKCSIEKMFIIPNPNVTISFDGTTFNYTGEPQTPEITVIGTPAEDMPPETITNYTVQYVGINGTDYPASANPPSMPGDYRVTCDVTDGNYSTPSVNGTSFTISKKTVDFNSDVKTEYFYGDAWEKVYTPSDADVTDFDVIYIKDGVTYTTPIEKGTYTVDVDLKDNPLYEKGLVTPSQVRIVEKPVKFTINKNPQVWTGEILYPEIVNDCGLIEGEDFTVRYFDESDNETAPCDAGEYRIDITLSDTLTDRYVLANDGEKVFIIYREEEKASITVGMGNSIFAQIEKAGIDTETKKSAFLENYLYDGTYYSPNAWADGENLDADVNAWFMYNQRTVEMPEVSAIGYGGVPDAPVRAVLKAKNIFQPDYNKPVEDVEIDVNASTFTPAGLPCGLYTLEYTIKGDTSDEPVVATRNVVVLWNLGDVNVDKTVNSIDGNRIASRYISWSEQTAGENLFKYRMCDVNKDGKVDLLDRDSLYNRIITRITEYYNINI